MPVLKKKRKTLAPAQTLALGFLIIILIGAFLLCLPFSSKSRSFTDFVDCIFTAASATCVTGISVVDTYTHWSIFGQAVIMALIQVGGLGFITLVTFFNLAMGKKLGFLQASNAVGDLTMTGLSSTKRIFTRVVLLSFVVETLGACLLMVRLVPGYGGYGVFMSFFTAVSAFCNAGFDLFGIEGAGVGMSIFADDPYVLLVTAAIIIMGGLGFVVWEELLAFRRTKTLSLHSKIVLVMTGLLIAAGTVIYIIVEATEPEIFGGYSFGQRIYTSFFASVSARTAGFSAASLPTANGFSKMITILLMFVGAAPGSTGGGIKVTTIAIVFMTAWSVIKGRDDIRILKHSIHKQTVYKTMTVLCLALVFMVAGFFCVYMLNTETDSLDTLFEVVSAFSTTGFSSGLSESSGHATKLILSFIMYVGRIGPISLMLSLTGRKTANKNEILPKGEIMVG